MNTYADCQITLNGSNSALARSVALHKRDGKADNKPTFLPKSVAGAGVIGLRDCSIII